MKQSAFVISMLLGASSAVSIRQLSSTAPETPTCTNANKATTEDETCSTAGNSAWNTVTSSRTAKPEDAQAGPYPGHAEHLQIDAETTPTGEGVTGKGLTGALDFKVAPITNICTNANKATTEDETCSTAGNSAWNTITSSRTAKPADAQAEPYPGHSEFVNFDSGSSHVGYPLYVPTNGGYPKVGPDQRAAKAPAADTQTPPADTPAPESAAWNKDNWYKTGSQKTIFGNNGYPQALSQFDSGSSHPGYPLYVPTNGGYPKVGPDQRAAKAPNADTQTPPADTPAPESAAWNKDNWYKTGSQKTIFGNNQYPQSLQQFDSGSSKDIFPPYVPTNDAYPKIQPDQRALTAPIVGTWTPPADTAAPEALGWEKKDWYKSGSQKSIFGNNEYPQSLSQFDSGSSKDIFPPYVPTNDAYPKIQPDQRALTAPIVGTWTPPADTAAPEALGWEKKDWYKTGSQKSIFGNNEYPQSLLQLNAETTPTGEGVTGKGFTGALDFKVSPATNSCVNTNKDSAEDEDCSLAGNSAWNTITTSRTAKPADAQAEPYPGHTQH